jgi:hypothetical protein
MKTIYDDNAFNYLMIDVQSLINLLNNLENTIQQFLTLVQSRPRLPDQTNIIANLNSMLVKIDIYRTALYEYHSTFQTSMDSTVKQLIIIKAYSNPNWLDTNNYTFLCNEAKINVVSTLMAIKVITKIKVSIEVLANTIGAEDNELMNLINAYPTIYKNLAIQNSPNHKLSAVMNNLSNNFNKFENSVLVPINKEVELGTSLLKDLL